MFVVMREQPEPRPVGHKVGSVYGTVSNSVWPNLRVTNVRGGGQAGMGSHDGWEGAQHGVYLAGRRAAMRA